MLKFVFYLFTITNIVQSSLNCTSSFQCAENSTCCSGIKGWGCCAELGAVCCPDGETCCPKSTKCDMKRKKCISKGIKNISYDLLQLKNQTFSNEYSEIKIFEGILTGLNLYKHLPHLKECLKINFTIGMDLMKIWESIKDFDKSKIEPFFEQIGNSAKKIFENFKEISEVCEKVHQEYLNMMKDVFKFTLNNHYVKKVKKNGVKNFDKIEKLYMEFSQESYYFNQGKLLGELFLFVFLPDI